MEAKILISIAALLGLYSLFTVREYFAKVILAVMILSVGLTFLPGKTAESGFWLYCVSLVLTVVYALLKRGLSAGKRTLILLITVPVFIAQLFMINKWPYVDTLSMICAVSFICFIICVIRMKEYKNEIGFLAIIAADAVIKLMTAISF